MELKGKALNLKIYCGESDKFEGQPLYEAIVFAARHAGLAGATSYRGIMSYGPSHSIHTIKVFALSSDLPIIVDIVDSEEQIMEFIPTAEKMMAVSGKGGMIITSEVSVYRYEPGKKLKAEGGK
jgi:PII-like signaling protein